MTLRVLWTYEHPTARLQEMMLFPAAGIEVVPTYTATPTGWLDSRYHDESHPMYPRWRAHCSLPVNLVEKIRRAQFWERDFRIDPEEAKLINDNFHGLFINCSPETLSNIFSWYKGKVLFRCNGGPNRSLLYSDARKWIEVASAHRRIRDFVYLPSNHNLVVPEMHEHGVSIIHFPVFVDEGRVPGQWAAKPSNVIATAISYLDFHQHFQGQLADMVRAYGGSQLHVRVFGKNKVARTAHGNVEIVGGLPSDSDFWGQIFACTAFVDAGADPTHQLFPPLEAAVKGMPVFFQRDNGNAHAIHDGLPDVPLDESIGVLLNHDDICAYLVKHHNNVDLLASINRKQAAVLKRIFSRRNAIMACMQIGELLQTRSSRYKRPGLEQALAQGPAEAVSLASLFGNGGGVVQLGKLSLRHGVRLADGFGALCREVKGPVTEAQVISENLPELPPGHYRMEIIYDAPTNKRDRPDAGRFEVGRWVSGGGEFDSQIITLPTNGTRGAIEFTVDEKTRFWRHEVRLSVYSWVTVTYLTIGLHCLDKAEGPPSQSGDGLKAAQSTR